MGLSGQLRASVRDLLGGLLAVVSAALPNALVGGVTAILTVLGVAWWQQNLFAPALAGNAGAGLPALGAALAGPVYAFLRRAMRRPKPEAATWGAPPHRIFVGAMAKPVGGTTPAWTAVQASF